MKNTVLVLVFLGGVARADLGDAHAVSISDDFLVGASHVEGQGSSLLVEPAADWFPFRGLSIGGEAGLYMTWNLWTSSSWSVVFGTRAGWAFHLPDRWTIWPRIGVEFGATVGVPLTSAHETIADVLVAKAIGDHLYLGMRAEIIHFSGADNVVGDVHGVLGATF